MQNRSRMQTPNAYFIGFDNNVERYQECVKKGLKSLNTTTWSQTPKHHWTGQQLYLHCLS
jgi:hypothetical protein